MKSFHKNNLSAQLMDNSYYRHWIEVGIVIPPRRIAPILRPQEGPVWATVME
jgi:hypothetical protein